MIDQTDYKLIERYRRASCVLALVAVIFGVAVYAGYVLDAHADAVAQFFQANTNTVHAWAHNLKAVFPQLPVAMNPGTAAGFILSGLSILILLLPSRRRFLTTLGICFSILVLLMGLVKLGGVMSNHTVYFDRALFHAQLDAEGVITGRPNQIAPNTALNFFFIGTALLLAYGARYRAAHYFASATFFIGLLAVLGYLYGVVKLIGIAQYIPMALNTAVAFEAVALALLFAFPDKGLMRIAASRSAGGIITRRLIPAAILVPAALGYLSQGGQNLGYFPGALALALLVLGNIVFFVTLIRQQSLVLHGIDEDRRKADEKLVEFISLASHQLKTPPGGIRWNAELLLDGSLGTLNKEQHAVAENIYTSAIQMVDTVNALLNVSRLDLGTFIVDLKPVNFTELARSIVIESKQTIDTKHITVTQVYDPSAPLIPADPGLSKIVLENLISNAIKYTLDGGSVHISIKVVPKNSILITVANTGYGIPKEQQSRIFEKMFRAGNVKDSVNGTGFGLYLLKSIVELAEGKVWFTSEENKGATFYVELPITGMRARSGTSHLTSA